MSELTTAIKERFNSPLFGNFIISWLLINWKIPYLTFFVNESTLKGVSKLDAVVIIIESYENPWYPLFIWPLLSTAVVIFIYPAIFNWIEIVKLKYQKWLKEIREKGDKELLSIRTKYTELEVKHKKLNDDFLKEFKYNVFHFEDKIHILFAGTWKVEMYFNTPASKHDHCFLEKETIRNSSSSLLFQVLKIDASEKDNASYENKTYKIDIAIDNITYNCEMYIPSRTFVQISDTQNRANKINLEWKGL